MKCGAFVAWLVLRITRWISWVSFLAYSFAITIMLTDQATSITSAASIFH